MDTRALKARDWKARCIVCGESFGFKEGFECTAQPGRHTVDTREYYHLGAGHIQSIRDRRGFSPTLNLAADIEVRDKVTGQITRLEGVLVHFKDGKYETSDPREQYYLDMHPSVVTGHEGKEAWDRMYLTNDQQLAKAQQRLADIQKEIRENNALLDVTKKQKGERDGVALR